jgi:hypothetical protein
MRNEWLHVRSSGDDEPMHVRTLQLRPSTINEEARTVDAVVATEDAVTSIDLRTWEPVYEILRMDGVEIPEQIPLLDNHSRSSIRSQVGSIRNLRVENGQLLGTLHVSASEEGVWTKIKERHITDVSVGQRPLETTVIPPGRSSTVNGRTYTAPADRALNINTRWRPREGSLTSIGADPRAKIRSQQESKPMNERLRKFLETLGLRADASEAEAQEFYAKLNQADKARADAAAAGTQPTNPPAGQTQPAGSQRSDPPPTPPADGNGRTTPTDPEEAARQAVVAERNRVRQLRELAGEDIPEETLRQAIDDGWDLTRASREFLTAVRTNRAAPVGPAIHSRSQEQNMNARSLAAGFMVAHGINDPTRHVMYNGLRSRAEGQITEQDADRGDQFRGMSAVDLCRMAAYLDTGRTYWDPDEAIRSAMSGATLNHVFSTNVYARLMEGWNEVADTTSWCDSEDVPNFLEQEDITLSAEARLKRHPRGGTATDATASDSHETYKIARFTRKFTADEQDILDDRLGAIMRMPYEMGQAAARLRPDLVYSILLANPALIADAVALFHATHKNLATGADSALSAAALKAAVKAMGSQRQGDVVLNIKPRFLIVPMALSDTAKECLTSTALAKVGTANAVTEYMPINILAGENITLVIDDRVGTAGVYDPTTEKIRPGSDTNWFLSAGGPRTIRVVYRRGTNRQPQLRSFTLDKGQWGIGWDIKHDIGAKAMDFPGMYKANGK